MRTTRAIALCLLAKVKAVAEDNGLRTFGIRSSLWSLLDPESNFSQIQRTSHGISTSAFEPIEYIDIHWNNDEIRHARSMSSHSFYNGSESIVNPSIENEVDFDVMDDVKQEELKSEPSDNYSEHGEVGEDQQPDVKPHPDSLSLEHSQADDIEQEHGSPEAGDLSSEYSENDSVKQEALKPDPGYVSDAEETNSTPAAQASDRASPDSITSYIEGLEIKSESESSPRQSLGSDLSDDNTNSEEVRPTPEVAPRQQTVRLRLLPLPDQAQNQHFEVIVRRVNGIVEEVTRRQVAGPVWAGRLREPAHRRLPARYRNEQFLLRTSPRDETLRLGFLPVTGGDPGRHPQLVTPFHDGVAGRGHIHMVANRVAKT